MVKKFMKEQTSMIKKLKNLLKVCLQVNLIKIKVFFDNIPKLYKDVEVNNPNTNVSSTVRLEGLNSFFT